MATSSDPVVHSVIGVDPGPSTGIAFLDYVGDQLTGFMSIQIDGKSAVPCLEAILARYYSNPSTIQMRLAQVEAFITGKSAGTKGEDAEVTRQLAFNIAERLQMWGYSVQLRKKADVSTWASDKRLKASGLLRPPENRHANDASRHGLFVAVHDGYKPDPLR